MAHATHHATQVPGSHAGAGQQRLVSPAWAVILPVIGGLVYGVWAAGNRRDAGPITTGNVLFGVVCGAAFALVCLLLHSAKNRMMREVRALSWTAFAGIAFGFLYSQSGGTVLRSTIMACGVAFSVFVVLFYRYYTTE
ncbi:hypothetical protein HUT18_16020 [Streptomyces sp. NA04227]|uniref:hypothetical protein n=1 Tax=Streptomyces sp. NA04227 TaxID=2742136 RepID=UPI00159159BD|nr:hypothetical protein [Streptomyces sp. NA04227]QKW07661.1 hypothetical protein HUT18_16020 [Streptomyces sp. NA04227]